jgi:hypothetical protein
MAPSLSASKFPTQSDFLMNRTWTIDMFASIGLISSFSPELL